MGRFGTLLHKILTENCEGIVMVESLEEADIVFPCVPISSFEEVIKKIAPRLKKGSLIMDVCSVKMFPVQVMLKNLPNHIKIMASHPLFGPDSANEGLINLQMVIWPIRVSDKKFRQTTKLFKNMGIRIIEMSPEEHDKISAFTQVYAHLIGRIGQDVGIKPSIIDTKGFQRLFSVQEMVTNDTRQLFIDMNRFNPFAKQMRAQVLQSLLHVEMELARVEKGGTIRS